MGQGVGQETREGVLRSLAALGFIQAVHDQNQALFLWLQDLGGDAREKVQQAVLWIRVRVFLFWKSFLDLRREVADGGVRAVPIADAPAQEVVGGMGFFLFQFG